MVGVRSRDHDKKRRLILDEAAGLFAKQGFTKTSVSEISAACKSSKAWIYHYFSNKEEILFTLLHEFLKDVDRRITDIKHTDAAEDVLHNFIMESLSIYDDYRINYPSLFNEMIFLPDAQQRELRKIEEGPVKLLEAILVRIRPDLAAAKNERSPTTLLVYGTINWTYTWFNPDGNLKKEQLATLILKFVLNGLCGMSLPAH